MPAPARIACIARRIAAAAREEAVRHDDARRPGCARAARAWAATQEAAARRADAA